MIFGDLVFDTRFGNEDIVGVYGQREAGADADARFEHFPEICVLFAD